MNKPTNRQCKYCNKTHDDRVVCPEKRNRDVPFSNKEQTYWSNPVLKDCPSGIRHGKAPICDFCHQNLEKICECHCHNNHEGMSPSNPDAKAYCKCLPRCEHCWPTSEDSKPFDRKKFEEDARKVKATFEDSKVFVDTKPNKSTRVKIVKTEEQQGDFDKRFDEKFVIPNGYFHKFYYEEHPYQPQLWSNYIQGEGLQEIKQFILSEKAKSFKEGQRNGKAAYKGQVKRETYQMGVKEERERIKKRIKAEADIRWFRITGNGQYSASEIEKAINFNYESVINLIDKDKYGI